MQASEQFAAKMPPASLDDDFSLPQIPQAELDRLTIQEDLTESQRILLLLGKTDSPAQQSYPFLNALSIFRDADNIQREVMPAILRGVTGWCEQVQIEAGRALLKLNEEGLLLEEYWSSLKQVCIVMMKQWNKAILKEWIQVYVSVVSAGRTKFMKIQEECIDIAINLTQSQQPLSVRQSSALMLEKIALKEVTTVQIYQEKLLPRVIALTKDANWEVRAAISKSFLAISKFLGSSKHFISSLQNLIEDSETYVQSKAINQIMKLITQKLEFEQLATFIKRALAIISDQTCPISTRNSALKLFPSFIQSLDSQLYGNDQDIDSYIILLIQQARKTDYGRQQIPSIFTAMPALYQKSDKFCSLMYPELIQEFYKSEINSHGITKEVKKAISYSLSTLLIASIQCSIQGSESGTKAALDLIDKYSQIIAKKNRDFLNELLQNAIDIFRFITDNILSVSKVIKESVSLKIREPLLREAEGIVIQNWRYHLSYYEKFLSKYLLLSDKDEATIVVFPIFIQGLCNSKTSQPVKKYVAEFFSEVISTLPNLYLRIAIQECMLKDLATSASSQQRQVFVFFLESLVPKISKLYFKQVFLEPYLLLAQDQVTSILLHYLQLIPQVRPKIDDIRTLERLTASLLSLSNSHPSADVRILGTQMLSKMKDSQYLKEVQEYQHVRDRQLIEKEHKIRDIEKAVDDTTPRKKKEMETHLKRVREEVKGGSPKSIGSHRSSQSSNNGTAGFSEKLNQNSGSLPSKSHIMGGKQQPQRRKSSENLKVLPIKVSTQYDKYPGAKTPSVIKKQ